MEERKQFDVVVLGGGPGGYTTAFRAADLGLKVCLIEDNKRLGGVCLSVGCIPSKTLLHAAHILEQVEQAEDYGIVFETPKIDIAQLRNKKDSVITKLTDGLDALCKARKITRIMGRAIFSSDTSLTIENKEGKEPQELRFAHAVIATGSQPTAIPNLPKSARIWDSTIALSLPFIPEELLIIGGGIIGLEMAQVYHALGSKITIVEMQAQIIPPADKDMVQPLFLKFKKKYTIKTKTKVSEIVEQDDKIQVAFDDGKTETRHLYDAVLVAVGRKPNTENLNLATLGLATDNRGFIPVDQSQRTSVKNIYAIGDVVGDPMLAHKASHQGKVAAEVINGEKSSFTPLSIPSVAYTNPELAWVGITERDAKEQGIEYVKGKFNWGASGRALSSGESIGASKVLFSKKTGRIIGAAICGLNAGELIHEAMLGMEMGADAEDISKTVHAHPTLSETFAFACEMVDGSLTDGMPAKKK